MKKKKYLKPQAHVVQTEPCMVNNLSQVRIYKGRFQTRQELEAAEFTLDEDGFLWGNKLPIVPSFYHNQRMVPWRTQTKTKRLST